MMKPKSILDPKFRYTPAVATDIRKTFAAARRAIKEKNEAQKAASK